MFLFCFQARQLPKWPQFRFGDWPELAWAQVDPNLEFQLSNQGRTLLTNLLQVYGGGRGQGGG